MISMTLFILFVVIIALLFVMINYFFAPHNPYQEKFSIFECGYHNFLGQNRTQFTIKFFAFSFVYLILELEIILTYPFANSGYSNYLYGLSTILLFIGAITLGFVFELGKNALKIASRQTLAIFNVKSSISVHQVNSNPTILQSKIEFWLWMKKNLKAVFNKKKLFRVF